MSAACLIGRLSLHSTVLRFPCDDCCLRQGLASRRDADICESGEISGVTVQNNPGQIGIAAALRVGQRPMIRFSGDFPRGAEPDEQLVRFLAMAVNANQK